MTKNLSYSGTISLTGWGNATISNVGTHHYGRKSGSPLPSPVTREDQIRHVLKTTGARRTTHLVKMPKFSFSDK